MLRLLCPPYPSLPPAERATIRRAVARWAVAWAAVSALALVAEVGLHPDASLARDVGEALLDSGLFLVALAFWLRLTLPIEARLLLADRRAAEDAARLDGVLLAARTAAHRVNNDLVRTVGYCHLLVEDPDLPEEARALAREALAGARAAADSVAKLRSVTRLEEAPESARLPPEQRTLDLERAADRGGAGT